MIRDFLQTIDGVSVYPLFSLIVFFIFFVALLIWAVKVDKGYLKKMEEMPLENEEEDFKNHTGELNGN